MKLKFIKDKLFRVLMIISMLIVFAFLGSILITILKNGWPQCLGIWLLNFRAVVFISVKKVVS